MTSRLQETRIEDIDSGGDDGKAQTPNFYRYFARVVEKMADIENLPRRWILLVISDGVGEYAAKNKGRIEGKLQSIIESASDNQIRIYAFGAVRQENAFLPHLAHAAERTYGVYKRIDKPRDLARAIRELAPRLAP